MDNLKYKNYKKLKDQFSFQYKGFAMEHILAFFIWNLANAKRPPIKRVIFFFKTIDFSFLEDIEGKYVIYSDDIRKDHSVTFNNISNRVKDRYEVINKSSGLSYPCVFSLKNIIKSIKLVFSNVESIGFVYKICAAGYLCMFINTIDKLMVLKIRKPKRFVVYSAIHERQNLLIQYFRMNGVHVVGLTHGTQFVYNKNIPIDCLNYENLDIDCLVWSQMTKDEYVKYGIKSDTLFVAGYPKQYTLKPIPKNGNMGRCIVLLSRLQFEESNMRLLEVLSVYSTEYTFSLKLHPSLNYAKYEKLCIDKNFRLIPQQVLLKKCIDSNLYDFAIAINTTSYYEIMLSGIPCLRFDDGDSYDLMNGVDEDRMATIEDFSRCMIWLKQIMKNGEYENIRRGLLKYNLGIGIDFYRDILLS